MKLFIWNEPFTKPYAGGIIYALADDEDAAMALAKETLEERAREGHPMAGAAEFPLPRPTEVFDAPACGIYEWSE